MPKKGRAGSAATIGDMLRVKLAEPGAKLPVVAHPGEDLGYDVFALEAVLLRLAKPSKCGQGSRSKPGIQPPVSRWDSWCGTGHRWLPAALPLRAV